MTITVEDIHLAGIPCQAELDTWRAEPMTYWEPGCPAGWELVEVLDRNGRPAEWLERKLSNPKVLEAFNEAVDLALDKEAEDYEADYGDYLYEQQKDRLAEGQELWSGGHL